MRLNKPNRLIHEKSPYLQQHAGNPVEWYPWGEEAFQKARRENKPVFLSIGYATCHWCHVMEKESFSDPDIAAVMNEHFVSIKVDREERPDVDKIYMTAAGAAGWGAGWPLSMWLTPELKPFFGGTYFPPDQRWGRPGFGQILVGAAEAWKTRKKDILSDADRLAGELERYAQVEGRSGELDPESLENGFSSYRDGFVSSKGGFGGAPKFPMPVNQNFLLRYHARTGEKKSLDMAAHTLREMAKGGIYDHIGGGFHRYSTDAGWHVPHFEKMLYDNAQLAVNYLETYQVTKDEEFARVARETLDYVLRDMTHPEGGFYSAEDADSLPPELQGKVEDRGHERRSEGAFYIWKKSEILEILGKEAGEIFSYRYGVEPNGNAASDPHGEFVGKNILYLAHTLRETAKKFSYQEAEIRRVLEESKLKLLDVRSRRPRPQRDDKVLADWNGLMISAFAKAAQVLGDLEYLKASEKAARFIKIRLYDAKQNRLSRRWREGEKKVSGLAVDYVLLTQGLLDLYEASLDVEWLTWAVQLADAQLELFYDREKGGFFMTSPGHDKNLLVRVMDDSDNVIPAESSVAALNLLRLAQFTGREDFRQAAEKTLTRFGAQMKRQPRSLPQMLAALDYALSKPKQIIIAGDPDSPDAQKMLRVVHDRFIPNKILMVIGEGRERETFVRWLPFLKGVAPVKGKPTAYVCVNYACRLPTTDLRELAGILDGKN
ncbi:MAG: thioredoxin domain-containing protein [Elusimicrobia bacterium RIFCSPHIGHO2_01_FULL_64_10]|nr:MAG: thioredoxin domain-containing protein [Elusimicrobia bacterium RIFCSPHIGHO2_01_FULL_64_10]